MEPNTGDDGSGDEPGDGQAAVVVENATSYTLAEVYVSRCQDDTWGPNRLESGALIPPGASSSWIVPQGCYDLRAVTTSGAAAESYGVDVSAASQWEITNAAIGGGGGDGGGGAGGVSTGNFGFYVEVGDTINRGRFRYDGESLKLNLVEYGEAPPAACEYTLTPNDTNYDQKPVFRVHGSFRVCQHAECAFSQEWVAWQDSTTIRWSGGHLTPDRMDGGCYMVRLHVSGWASNTVRLHARVGRHYSP